MQKTRNENDNYTLKGKIIIKGSIKLITGLHIGTGGDFSAIGAVDNIVIRDSITKLPMIPGSSLKGKMRYLLYRTKYSANIDKLKDIKDECVEINRLFGSSKPEIIISRLQFQDMLLSEKSAEKLKKADLDLPYTEIKYENTINRLNSTATPRQQERVPAGAEFDFKLTYNIENICEIEDDMDNLILCIKVLEDDYLGGHGTRGYGRVRFENLTFESKYFPEENKENLSISIIENKLENVRENIKKYIESR